MTSENQAMQEAFETTVEFMGGQQLAVVDELLKESEEKEHFQKIILELADRISNMPETYGQDGKGDEAIAYLHYFIGGCDWYITERDSDPDGEGQIQAFGYADLGMGCPELGYISIKEITEAGAELDFYWTPKTLREIKSDRNMGDAKKKLISDTLTTAVECNGIYYWCAAESVVYGDDGVTKVIGPFDVEDENNKWPDITLDTVRLGYERIVNGSVKVGKHIRDGITSDWNDPENATYMDSESADCIVQAGLFNEIIYG